MGKIKAFFLKKGVKPSLKLYFIDAMGAMAQGLFASLLIGTILGTIGEKFGIEFLGEIAAFAKNGYVVGASIGIAAAFALGAQGLVLYSSVAIGAIGYMLGAQIHLADGSVINYTAGPAGAFFAVLVAAELGKLVYKSTKVDIIVTPVTVILSGYGISRLICPAIAYVMYYLGDFINTATELRPFAMGIIVSVVVGIILTLPISSAAICAMIGIAGLAGGAATAGCCAQMVGFAVMSFKENGVGGLASQGIGTSMLQMPNILKKPRVWLPPIIASAIAGPIATCVFKLQMNGPAVSSGMGTCGLVGQIGVYTGWVADVASGAKAGITAFDWAGLLLVSFVLPAVLCAVLGALFRKKGWIKDGDLKLD